MKWYVCLGVICILLAVCSYNMYNRYEQEDIEIETVLIKMSEENERKRQELNYDYLEILIRSEKELMEYKDLYAITGKNYIQYDTAGMYKEPEFKYCLKASATKIWISILRINILFDKICSKL